MSATMRTMKTLKKICFVGDLKVGKTQLMKQIAHGNFSTTYKATKGVDFATRDFPENDVKLQMWDVGGSEIKTNSNMLRLYLHSACAIVCCFDLSDANTFNNLENFVPNIKKSWQQQDQDKGMIAIIGCKKDQQNFGMTQK